ncbi:MAG: TRAP transporter substrate-binding protein [Roseibium album]|uniref:Extracytoplasmic solute receptor protein YiaO n=2 Tax=cellular organisms TaxID=131567 RepID=A0A0M6ZB16_9HYPH|nr:TRAP transporter substrate-binding protein [Roseibium album]MBG6143117.1 TRAP-type C4-dicarboxylate transport system substrate-binding protein [Labrenzia sp. EL_142]MBG6157149.1 TRAP-type C4-dicarboxylate transport system substrate-binding protein [Labrenzia sp. EL_162]MBG6172397.1 TRAP-type C4-dicarboxylate transport system substrate-binding protein [Labrenzia sp. EL_132]MBG6194910.1 TRAP-type C4-dicarboxylate transport system substrate-binding protein [Labrenzia sp. EL_159]MBG6203508.1 TR
MDRRTFLKTTSLTAAMLAAPGIASAAAEKTLRIGTITPGSHFWTQTMDRVGASMAEKSGGKFDTQVFPSGQLGNEATMIQQLQSGGLDMGFLTVAEFSNRLDDMAALFTPYLVQNVSQASKLLTGPTATGMLEQYSTLGMKGLGFGLGGMRHLISREPGLSSADLAGRKYRITPFAPLRDFYELMDVAPTPVPLPGLFDALANGQVDGADIDLELAWKLKLYDQAPNLTITSQMMFPVVAVVSGRYWAALSDDEKQMLSQSVSEQIDWLFAQYVEFEPKWLNDLKGTGINVVDAEPGFFGDTISEWKSIWEPKAPSIAALQKEAKMLAG